MEKRRGLRIDRNSHAGWEFQTTWEGKEEEGAKE
jgi:hypothetical protein